MQWGGRERISGVIFAMRMALRWVQGLTDALEIGQTVHVNKRTIHLYKQHLSTCSADRLALYQSVHVYHPSNSLVLPASSSPLHFALTSSFTHSQTCHLHPIPRGPTWSREPRLLTLCLFFSGDGSERALPRHASRWLSLALTQQ